jgi:hypothetical protein
MKKALLLQSGIIIPSESLLLFLLTGKFVCLFRQIGIFSCQNSLVNEKLALLNQMAQISFTFAARLP